MVLATPNPNVPRWLGNWAADLPDWLEFFFQYKTYALLFAAAALSTFIFTPVYIIFARRLGWVDAPGGRKRHRTPTATMGGLVVFGAVFCGAAVALSLENRVGQLLREHDRSIYVLLGCTAAMIALGAVDDRHALRPSIKITVQTIVAVAAVWFGYRIQAVTVPGVGSLDIAALGLILSVLWIVGITNAVNLTDGLDGLAAGVGFMAAAVNAVVAVWLGNYYMAVMMTLLAGALLGFLRWNFHPARVFLGDTGALAIGMFLALASLHSAQKAQTLVMILVPLFALGYPIFDTLLAVARRMARGQPLFASDRDHIHHRLVDRGASQGGAALRIYLASMLLCAACFVVMSANHLAIGLALAGVLTISIFCVRTLGYLEWGGWAARSRAREDQRAFHAAARLARLRLRRAADPLAVIRAVAVVAPEINCRVVRLVGDSEDITWQDPAASAISAADAPAYRLELALDGRRAFQFDLTRPEPLASDVSAILEDLCALALERLDGTSRAAS